jgi:hypothetical protein
VLIDDRETSGVQMFGPVKQGNTSHRLSSDTHANSNDSSFDRDVCSALDRHFLAGQMETFARGVGTDR